MGGTRIKFLVVRVFWRLVPQVYRDSWSKKLHEFVENNRWRAMAFVCTGALLIYWDYLNHLDELLSKVHQKQIRLLHVPFQQIKQQCDEELQGILIQHQSSILPANHPATIRVKRVFDSILNAAHDIGVLQNDKVFEVYVIDHPVQNACALPNGVTLVFTGMLQDTDDSDHKLACLLGHEVSHVIAQHSVYLHKQIHK
ncbi:metalloendopeptidase OMA1 [Reticulomyxa filosa]|uniref:Metalloendopeptidase OMA1 n=1 Tax=Reticulomyxa filosa TaxID=46433 RepID=X6NML4_RETFI|nr:metalloendopeptidase OMA1 [Reticulomyxa filosa]|eukprot:ETO26642.1 metalloendopeptidase OMA1 [Reticulomyxa filosa]